MNGEPMLTTAPGPVLALQLDAPTVPGAGVGVLIINYNTARQTLRCLESIQCSTLAPEWVLVLDNASCSSDYQVLLAGAQPPTSGSLRIFRSETNLGFAEGSNVLIDLLLKESSCEYIMLLNNDAVAQQEMLSSLVTALKAAGSNAGLAGGRMHKLADPTKVDTLGIAIYASLMPADRKTEDDVYVGPTGGCCMLTKQFIERSISAFGYCFDRRFFCYCEDTDLVLRGILMGYQPVYVNDIVALHEGQASSGGNYSDFIAYHGLRNAIWTQVKLVPAQCLRRYWAHLLLAHMAMLIRSLLTGRAGLVARVYRDAWKRLPEFIAERDLLATNLSLNSGLFQRHITGRFYRKGYLSEVLRKNKLARLFRR